jgi:hypothetical protein
MKKEIWITPVLPVCLWKLEKRRKNADKRFRALALSQRAIIL